MTTRADDLQTLAENMTALTSGTTTTTPLERSPGQGEDGRHRKTPVAETHRAEHLSLLQQLTAALVPSAGNTDPNGGGGAGKPGSRIPSAAGVSNALDQMHSEAGWLQRDMRHQLRRPPRRLVTLAGLLEDIRGLAHASDDAGVRTAAAATSRWVTLARNALALDAPVATLRDLPCPHCGTRLKVRQDGSSDVWCPNPACRDVEGRRHRWAKPEWPFLLERIAGQRGEGAA